MTQQKKTTKKIRARFYIPQSVRENFKYKQVLVSWCSHYGAKKFKQEVDKKKVDGKVEKTRREILKATGRRGKSYFLRGGED